MLDFAGLCCRCMDDHAAGTARVPARLATACKSEAVISAVFIGSDRLVALQWLCRLFCNGTTDPLCGIVVARNAVWADGAAAFDPGFAFTAIVGLAAALWNWHIVAAASGSKGNHLAFQFIFLLRLSEAMGGKYAALSPFISGTLCSDIGVVCAAFFILRRLAGFPVFFWISGIRGEKQSIK